MAVFRTCILLRTAAVGSLVLQGGGLNFSGVHAARPGGNSSGEGAGGAPGAGDDQPVDSHSSPSTPRGPPSKEVATPTAPRSPVTAPFQSPAGGRAAPGSPNSPPPPGPTPTTPPPLYQRGAPSPFAATTPGAAGPAQAFAFPAAAAQGPQRTPELGRAHKFQGEFVPGQHQRRPRATRGVQWDSISWTADFHFNDIWGYQTVDELQTVVAPYERLYQRFHHEEDAGALERQELPDDVEIIVRQSVRTGDADADPRIQNKRGHWRPVDHQSLMDEDIQLPTYKNLEKAFTALWTYKFLHPAQAPGGAPANSRRDENEIVPPPDEVEDDYAILQEATDRMSVDKYQLVTPADLAWQYRGDVDAPNRIRRWYDVLRFAMETLVRGERGAALLRLERMLQQTYRESTPELDLTRQQETLQMLSDDPRRPENQESLRDVQQSTHDFRAYLEATAADPNSAEVEEMRAERVRKLFALADTRTPPPVISLTGAALDAALSAAAQAHAYYSDPRLLDASTPMPGNSNGAVAPWLGFQPGWVPKQAKVNPLAHLRPYMMKMRKDQTESASGDSEAGDDDEEDANSVAEDEDLGMTGAAKAYVADSPPESDQQELEMKCALCKKLLRGTRADVDAHYEEHRKKVRQQVNGWGRRVEPSFLFDHEKREQERRRNYGN